MSLFERVNSIPPSLKHTLFPIHQESKNPAEVNGLPADAEPQNCVILLAHKNYMMVDYIGYLVKTKTHLCYLRLRDAMEGSGYERYAVIHVAASLNDEEACKAVIGFALRQASICVK